MVALLALIVVVVRLSSPSNTDSPTWKFCVLAIAAAPESGDSCAKSCDLQVLQIFQWSTKRREWRDRNGESLLSLQTVRGCSDRLLAHCILVEHASIKLLNDSRTNEHSAMQVRLEQEERRQSQHVSLQSCLFFTLSFINLAVDNTFG